MGGKRKAPGMLGDGRAGMISCNKLTSSVHIPINTTNSIIVLPANMVPVG